jgi:sarcosine oxidase subunit beta
VTAVERSGSRVVGLTTTRGPIACDQLVLAAGAWSTGLAQELGIALPVAARAPQMIATSPMPPLLDQVVGALGRTLSLKQIPTGNYVIGGGWPGRVDLTGRIARPLLESILGSLRVSSTIFPALLEARVERVWVGIEAETPDQVPILGRLPGAENLFVATGFSGHGFALSPIVGQVMSELILGGAPSIPIGQLSFERFAAEPEPFRRFDAG